MKINFTVNTNVKLEKTLNDLEVNYGVVYYIDKTHDAINSQDSFSIKLLGKIESLIRSFKKIDVTQQQHINAIGNAIDYSNKYMHPESINGLKVHLNTKTKTNAFCENALIGITKHILDFGTYKASYLHNKKMILLGASSLEETFLSAKEKFSTEDITQFIFFHELSHGLERFYRYHIYKDKNDTSITRDYDTFMTKIFLTSVDKYIKGINEQVEKYNKNGVSPFTTLNADCLQKLHTLASENYADISGLLHLRNYQITNNTYNHEQFIDFINCIAQDRASHQQKFYASEIKESNSFLSLMLSIGHFTTNALSDLKKQMELFNKEAMTNDEIHILTNKTTEKAMLKLIYTLSKTDENIDKMFNTCCATGMGEEHMVLGASHYSYSEFKYALEKKLDIVWLANFNHSLFMAQEKIKDPQKLMEACFNIYCYPEKYQEQLSKEIPGFIKENLTTNTVKEKINSFKITKTEDNNILLNKI